jgi:hypothetical protein
MEFERLAYDSALRALDKQEALLNELRSRTGVLLAASALAASFLGETAFGSASGLIAAVALGAFLFSIGASVFILVPRADGFVFSLSGRTIHEELFEFKGDLEEVYRRLAYDLERVRAANNIRLLPLLRAYRLCAASLVVEILALVALVRDTIL